jgi:predicted transcriptional regulator
LICSICLLGWSKLGLHIRLKHHMSVDEYRRKFGLPSDASLVSESLRVKPEASAGAS